MTKTRSSVAFLTVLLLAVVWLVYAIISSGGERHEGGKGPSGGQTNGGEEGGSSTEGQGSTADGSDTDLDEQTPGSVPTLGKAGVNDPPEDTQDSGRSPYYIDIRSASVEDLGEQLRLQVVVQDSFAERLPAKTTARLGFVLERDGRDVSVGAEGGRTGWTPLVDNKTFSGTFHIEGDVMTFIVPWEAVGGRGGFFWWAESKWTQDTELVTDYSFDRAPQERSGFPR